MFTPEQVESAESSLQTIWGTLRPKDQRELLEEYVTCRTFLAQATALAGESSTPYVDQEAD